MSRHDNMNPLEFQRLHPDARPRGLRSILGTPTGSMVNTGRQCPFCGDALWRTASDTNDPACLSARCAERRGKVDTEVPGHDFEAQRRNAQCMSELQESTGLRINPDRWAHWRPTKEVAGEIPGVALAICLATDGNVAWFKWLGRSTKVTDDAHPQDAAMAAVKPAPATPDLPLTPSSHFFGHVHRFEWQDAEGATQVGCPPSAFAKDKVKTFKPKVKKKTRTEKLDDLLSGI